MPRFADDDDDDDGDDDDDDDGRNKLERTTPPKRAAVSSPEPSQSTQPITAGPEAERPGTAGAEAERGTPSRFKLSLPLPFRSKPGHSSPFSAPNSSQQTPEKLTSTPSRFARKAKKEPKWPTVHESLELATFEENSLLAHHIVRPRAIGRVFHLPVHCGFLHCGE